MKNILRTFGVLILVLALNFLGGCITADDTASTPAPADSTWPSRTPIISKYYYWFEKNGRDGIINERGQVVLPFEYSNVCIIDYNDTPTAILAVPADVKTDGKESSDYDVLMFDLNGALVYKIKYYYATPLYAYTICDGLIELFGTEGCSAVSYEGKEVIPFGYNSIVVCGNYILAVSGDYYNHPGRTVDVDIYDKKGSLQKSDKLNLAYTNTNPNLIMVNDDTGTKYGLMDLNFEEVVPAEWDVLRYEGNGLYIACLGKKWGVIDDQGKVVIPVKYNKVFSCNDSGDRVSMFFSAEDEDGVYLFDGSGKQRFFSDKFIYVFYDNGIILAQDQPYVEHYINPEGEDIIPPAEYIDMDASGIIIWENSGDSACYTKDGIKLPLPEAENIEIISPERFIFTTKGDKLKGICGADGSIIVLAEYNDLNPLDEYYCLKPFNENNDLIIFSSADKGCGVIDPDDGRIVLDGFDSLSYAGGGLFRASKGAVYGLADINGNWIWQTSEYETLMD